MNVPDALWFTAYLLLVGSLLRIFLYSYPDNIVAHWIAFAY